MVVYCDSVNGSDTSPYETLAKAAVLFLTAVDELSAGEDLLITSDHSEAPGSSQTYAFPGTASQPNRVISIDPADETYEKATGIQINLATSGTFDMTITGFVKFYGISIEIGDDIATIASLMHVLWDDCLIEFSRAGGVLWSIGSSSGQHGMKFKNTEINFSGGGANNAIALVGTEVEFHGGKIAWTGTQPTVLFTGSFRLATLRMAGTDLSDITNPLIDLSDASELKVELHNCLIAGSITTGTILNAGTQVLASGCDTTGGNKLYRLDYVDYYGSTVHDDAIFVTTDGAKDPDGNKISWKIDTTANAKEFSEPHISPPIPIWVNSTGSKTFTIKGIWDSPVDIQTDEAWIEIEFLEASADTDSAFENDGDANIKISIDGNSVDQDNNTETWTGTSGFTNENKIDLGKTVTVNRVGPALCRIHVAKPSITFYADPKVIVT